MLCYVMLCYVMLCYVMLSYVMLLCYVVMLCYVMLCYVMFCCYVMLCYVMLCYVMLCYVMLCYVMLCYVMLLGYVTLCYVMLLCYDMIYDMTCYVMLCCFMLCCYVICCVKLCYVTLCYSSGYRKSPQLFHISLSLCWIKRDQLDVTCFIISLFTAQHVSDVSTSNVRSLRLICWVISCVLLLWFDVCWCYGVVRLGWCGILMQAEALRALYMKTDTHFRSFLVHFFLEWEMFQTKVVEKIKTHILWILSLSDRAS